MASDKLSNTSDGTFQRDVLDSNIPVLVDFWATWCGPCRAIAPHLEALASAKEFEGKVKIVKLDVDHNQDTAVKYGVQSIPTLILFKDGKEFNKLVGAANRGKLTEFLKSAIDQRAS
jgi:thioredoxin 1